MAFSLLPGETNAVTIPPSEVHRAQAVLFSEFGAESMVLSPRYCDRVLSYSPDVAHGISVLRSILTWRRAEGINEWTAARFASVEDDFSKWFYVSKRDVVGRPVITIHFGEIHFGAIDVDLLVDYCLFIMDQVFLAHDNLVMLNAIDVNGATSLISLGFCRKIVAKYVSYYPHRGGRFLIAARSLPRSTKFIYNIVKRLIPTDIACRNNLLDGSAEISWAADALWDDPARDAPAFLGGDDLGYADPDAGGAPVVEVLAALSGSVVYLGDPGAVPLDATAAAGAVGVGGELSIRFELLHEVRRRQYLGDDVDPATAALVSDTLRRWISEAEATAAAAAAAAVGEGGGGGGDDTGVAESSDFATCVDHTTDEEGGGASIVAATALGRFDAAALRNSLAEGERTGASDLSYTAQRKILLQAMEILEAMPLASVVQYTDSVVQQRLRSGSPMPTLREQRSSGTASALTAAGGGADEGAAAGAVACAGDSDGADSVTSNCSDLSISTAGSGRSDSSSTAWWRRRANRYSSPPPARYTSRARRQRARVLVIRGSDFVLLRSNIYKRASKGLRKWHERVLYLTTSHLAWRTLRADSAERSSAGIEPSDEAVESDLAIHSRRLVPLPAIVAVRLKRGSAPLLSSGASGGGGDAAVSKGKAKAKVQIIKVGSSASKQHRFPFGVSTRGGEELLFFTTTVEARAAWVHALQEIIALGLQ